MKIPVSGGKDLLGRQPLANPAEGVALRRDPTQASRKLGLGRALRRDPEAEPASLEAMHGSNGVFNPDRKPAAEGRWTRLHQLSRTQVVAKPREEVFAFFSDASNLEALTPPFLRFRILTPLPIAMRAGTQIDYALSLFGAPVRWRTRIKEWQPGSRFVDEQESGPYALWVHTHEFESRGTSTLVRDVVHYAEPLGPLGAIAHVLFVRRTLDRIFDFRRDAIRRLLGHPAGRTPGDAREASHVHSP